MKKWMMNVVAIGVVMAVASSAWAVPLVPPQQVSPGPTSGSAPWGSLTLKDELVSPYNAGVFSGTLHSLVYQEAGGTLDFFYQVTSASAHPVLHMSVTGYNTAATDMYWVTDSTILPVPANSTLGSVGYFDFYRIIPDVIGGDFAGGLANASSYWMVVRTDATSYGHSTAFIQDGGQASAETFAPAPLPSSLVLFATGAVGLAGGLVRRMRRSPV